MERRIAAGFVHAAPWIPLAAAAGIIAALYLPGGAETHQTREEAVLFGLAFAAVIGVVATLVTAGRSTPQHANSRAYAQVMERVRALQVRIECVEGSVAKGTADPCDGLSEARAQLRAVEERLCLSGPNAPSRSMDPSWTTGTAYQDLWNGIHRAEEALVCHAPHEELLAMLAGDRMRVATSPLARGLDAELGVVVRQLADGGHDGEAAIRLRNVHRAINEFRDGRWDGLITARTHLVRSALMTAWTAFGLLILAVALGASRDSIAAGGVFFLVGAVVGLLAQVRSDARHDDVVEDYGLAAARLYQKVLASGLAGVAGVLLMPIAVDLSNGSSGPTASLASVFDVTQNPGQLLLAAAFGLSPQRLFARLSASSDEYKAQLSSTQVASVTPSPDSDADGNKG